MALATLRAESVALRTAGAQRRRSRRRILVGLTERGASVGSIAATVTGWTGPRPAPPVRSVSGVE
jgi:hypothetical protein